MPCRVGISTNPVSRKIYWQSQVIGLRNWRIIKSFRTKGAAQKYETEYARKYGCKAAPGGADASGTWYVYRFDYLRSR